MCCDLITGAHAHHLLAAPDCEPSTGSGHRHSPARIQSWLLWWGDQWVGAECRLLQGDADLLPLLNTDAPKGVPWWVSGGLSSQHQEGAVSIPLICIMFHGNWVVYLPELNAPSRLNWRKWMFAHKMFTATDVVVLQ